MNNMESLHQSVQHQYEQYPYPGYPLWFRPHWPSGYMGASWFSKTLLKNHLNLKDFPQSQSTLLLGCGDMQPYIFRKIESTPKIVNLDFSKKTLQRAKLRNFPFHWQMEWVQDDVMNYLKSAPTFDHVDAFGVLHHLADPKEALQLLSLKLTPLATMRIMIYQEKARSWIHHIQKLLRVAGFHLESLHSEKNRTELLDFLLSLEKIFPFLKEKFSQVGRPLHKQNIAWIVDAFLHQREMRRPIFSWLKWFEEAGLKPFALFDRHGNWDDQLNPLWHFPQEEEMKSKITHSSQGHWEFYLYKDSPIPKHTKFYVKNQNIPKNLWIQTPPKIWNLYDEELSSLNFLTKSKVWHHLLVQNYGHKLDLKSAHLSLNQKRRLSRLGAYWPQTKAEFDQLSKPIKQTQFESKSEPTSFLGENEFLFQWWQNWVHRKRPNWETKSKQAELGAKILLAFYREFCL